MGQPRIHEGTSQELARYLAQHPHGRFRLTELETEAQTPITSETLPAVNARSSAAIAYLNERLHREATDDPEEIRRSEAEYEELKRSLNANRALTEERPVFP